MLDLWEFFKMLAALMVMLAAYMVLMCIFLISIVWIVATILQHFFVS